MERRHQPLHDDRFGVATQSPWLMRGLDPTLKAARAANYVLTLRKEILQLSRACGASHPSLVPKRSTELLDGAFRTRTLDTTWPAETGAARC